MKLLSQEEYEEMRLKFVHNNINISDLYKALKALKLYEALHITKEDWTLTSKPSMRINSYFRKDRTNLKFSIRKLKNNDGWVVVRIK